MNYGYNNFSYPKSLLYNYTNNVNQTQSAYSVSADSLLSASTLLNQSQLNGNPFSLSTSTSLTGTQTPNMGDLMSIVQYLVVGLLQMFGQAGTAAIPTGELGAGNGTVNNDSDLQKQLTDAEAAAAQTQTALDAANAKKKDTASQLATANPNAGKTQSAFNSAQSAQKSAKTKADKAKKLKTNVHTMTDEWLKGNWNSDKYKASIEVVTRGGAEGAPAEYHQAYKDWLAAANRYYAAVNSDTITEKQFAAKKKALEIVSNKLKGIVDKFSSAQTSALSSANTKLKTAQTNDKNADTKVTDLKKADADAKTALDAALAADQEADKKVAELKKKLEEAQAGVQNT